MLRLLKYAALSLLLACGGAGLSQADNLTVQGLGTIPLGDKIRVTDGKDNEIGKAFVATSHQKNYGKTARAAMWSMLTVPPGMEMYPEKGPYPYDSMHRYQLKLENVKGIYTAAVFVFSGTSEDFFHEGNKKAAAFWQDAFRQDAGRPTSLFGMPKIRIEEFQNLIDEILKERGGAARSVTMLTFAPWHAFKNEDGTYHWSQEAKVIITNEKGLSFPMWIYTSLYKEGDRYYLIEVNGSHEAADELENSLVYGLYRLERKAK